jgi:hypothetical protein
MFTIITYARELPPDLNGEKMDEKIEFVGGFRLPGLITVRGQEMGSKPDLRSQYQEQQQIYPVKSLFQPRVDENAKAEFTISLTQAVTANQLMVIACTGAGAYDLKDSPFVVIGTEQVETSTALNEKGEVEATLKPGRPASEIALQANTPYMVILWVIPRAGTSSWRFDTTDLLSFPGGISYPTNTNDAETIDFAPVKKLSLVVQTDRSPPGARVNVLLNVDRNGAVIRELLIIAPPAFVFPATGCGDMCLAGQALGSTGRRTATIASPTGEPLSKLEGLNIQVVTPEKTPGSTSWFVEGRGQGAGKTTGWGEGAGFMVNQMANSGVSYPGVANLKGALIAFRFSLDVDAGSQISVVPPTGYLLTCSTDGALRQISLPGKMPDCVDDPLELILDRTLTVGEYAFAISVDLPKKTPDDNTFNIIVKNINNQVVDAAYGLPGQKIHEDIGVANPTLSWSDRPEAAERTIITFGLTFTAPTDKLKALLLNFPDKFIHDVQRPTDVQNLNKRFRVAAGQDWADTSFTDRIKIRLDDSDDSTTVAADTYMWNFPAMVPCCSQEDMPRNNVWYLSLCEDLSCKQPGDKSIIVTFPMAGFALDELSPETVGGRTGGAKRQSFLGTGVRVLLALFAPGLLAVISRGA